MAKTVGWKTTRLKPMTEKEVGQSNSKRIDNAQHFLYLKFDKLRPGFMKTILLSASNWKFILPLFILFFIFAAVLFPYYQGRMAETAKQDVIPLDSRFSYSYEEVKNAFDQLGPEGRSTYRFVIACVDMLFPLIYGLLFILVLAWLLKKVTRQDSGWILFSLFPCVGIIFDYLENFNTLSLLNQFPDITAESVEWGEQMTQLKHTFLFLAVAFMPLLALSLLIKSFRRRGKR